MQSDRVSLHRVLPPHISRVGSVDDAEKVGRRQVYQVGEGGKGGDGHIGSSEYVCGTARFRLLGDKNINTTQGFLSVALLEDIPVIDTKCKPWMIMPR